jgi:pimeloyl-ACP methyl ester carboxylesterase
VAPTGTVEEGIFDFLTGGPKPDPSLPEIIFLHGIMGGHLAAFGSFGGRVWLSPLAFAAGKVARRLTLTDDGQSDLLSSHALYPDGPIRMVYEKAARKWRIAGFVVHEFAYDWRKPIANSADRLDLFIKTLSLERPAKKFAIVGHSMGGLVAALYAARHPEWSTRITQAIFLGSPLRGSYAPIEALLGTYPLFPKFALVDTQDDLGDYIAMARTCPGLIDMLPDPDVFPDAAPLYERATWPETGAPAQIWLDQSRQVKRLLAASPILETARLIASPAHPTVGDVRVVGGKLQPGRRNAPGDGTVPTRSAAANLSGLKVHRATFSHGELPREPAVIDAVADLLKNGTCQLPLLSPEEIASVVPIEEAVTEGIEEATAMDFGLRLRSGIFTQRDVDFLLRADHATLPGATGPVS